MDAKSVATAGEESAAMRLDGHCEPFFGQEVLMPISPYEIQWITPRGGVDATNIF